jgi:small subunit ribosomal protein S8
MSCSDPIADMLTVIRNGLLANKQTVTIPHSSVKADICEVLKKEGYINGFDSLDTKPARTIQVRLRYGPDGTGVITAIKRISSPGCRIYARRNQLKPIIRGLGIAIISTSSGILSDRDCRKQNLGGEVLCEVK